MLPFLGAHKGKVRAAFGAALLGQGVAAFAPVIQKVVIDDAILSDRRPLAPWLVLLVLTGVVRFGAAYVRRFVGGRVGLDVQYDIRNTIYDQLQRLDFASHDQMQTGQLVSRASSDVALVQGLLAVLPITIGNLVMLVISVVIMFVLSVPLTLVALLVIPAILAAAVRMRTTVFPAAWDAQQRAAEVAGVVDESVSGVRVVKGFGQEDRELDRLVGRAGDMFGSRMRSVRISARFTAGLQAIPVLGQVAILAVGGWLTIRGTISIGTFLAFSTYLVQMVAPARMLAIMLTVGQQARAGAERILELLDSNPLVRDDPDAVELPALTGRVELDDVRFGYLRAEPVLDGVSLTVEPGETVALVGASGSGKSTVALLLPRFYDVQDGALRVDGHDVRHVTLASLRRQIGVVFEDSFLFSDTIRSNIAYGRPDTTFDDVVAAAKASEAHGFITDLPEGYDTVVGERGLTLSGGQRQRIALARALLTDPRILVLDDATSSIDARVEEEIHDTLRRLMQGRTTLLIAHRRSTLRLADRIVVLERGRVVDSGTHEQLLDRCPLYRQLLAGPGDDVEGIDAEPDWSATDGVTADAWAAAANGEVRARADVPIAVGGMVGGGMGGGGGGGGMMGGLGNAPPTEELLAALARLEPVVDVPDVDVERERQPDAGFTLRRFLRPYRRPLLIAVALVMADALMTLAGPALVRRGIDDGVVQGSTGALWAASFAFLLVALADWWDTWAMTRWTGRTAERMLFALRVRIFAQLQRLGLDFYEREMAGRIMTRMTSDVEALSQLLQQGVVGAVVNLVTFVGVAGLLLTMNLRLGLTTMLIVPPLVLATIVFRRLSDRAYLKARDRIATLNANFQESLSGVREAQAFVREGRNESDFRKVNASHLDARLEAQRLQALYFPFVELLSVVATVLVLGVGSTMLSGGTLTEGELVAFLLYLTQLFAPIQQLSQVFDTYQQAKAAMTKISEVLAEPTSTPESPDAVDPGRLRGEVWLESVTFAYAGAPTPALRGVDLRVPAGQTIALVGETGAGKSTIVKLVARFYDPTAGRVLVDGIPVTDLDLSAFRRQLGYVPQEPFLFSGTLRDNIAYGRPEATDAEVEAAARAVGAHDFVASLPGGYLHAVTERGRSLSAGQRQLIALARARLVDPAVLLLDEATSNLDLATEARVNRAMGAVAEGRTTLLIAHRLQTAARADRIVVVDDGRIVEDGTHDELVARGGRYPALWASFSMEDAPAA